MKSWLVVILGLLGLAAGFWFLRELDDGGRMEVNQPQSPGDMVGLGLSLNDDFVIGIYAEKLPGVRDLLAVDQDVLVASLPSQGRVVALKDEDNDGRAEEVINLVERLNLPHGLARYQNYLFIAEETRVVRYEFDVDNLKLNQAKELFQLPGGGRHKSRSLAVNSRGQLFVSIGSSCDACVERNPFLAAVIVSDISGKRPQLWARGLRNSVFIRVKPDTDELWGTEMGRDFLGDDLPPEEINIIRQNRDYGWPFCYGDKVVDTNFRSEDRSDCGRTEDPFYLMPAHVAPLGLTFVQSDQFPANWQGDLLVSYHGSWNSSVPVGYKVVRLDIEGERVVAEEDFVTGFLRDSEVYGRPVDLEFDGHGNLFISDDKGGRVFQVSKR